MLQVPQMSWGEELFQTSPRPASSQHSKARSGELGQIQLPISLLNHSAITALSRQSLLWSHRGCSQKRRLKEEAPSHSWREEKAASRTREVPLLLQGYCHRLKNKTHTPGI